MAERGARGIAEEIGEVGRSIVGLVITLAVAALVIAILGNVASAVPGGIVNTTDLFNPIIQPWGTFATLIVYGGILALVVYVIYKGIAAKI